MAKARLKRLLSLFNPIPPLAPYTLARGGMARLNRWFITLRFYASLGSALTAFIAIFKLHLLPSLALPYLLTLSLFLTLVNLLYLYLMKRVKVESLLRIQMFSDLLFLYLFFAPTGDLANPLCVILFVHVILGVILFPPRESRGISALILGEFLLLFFTPSILPESTRFPLYGITLSSTARATSFLSLSLATVILHIFVSVVVKLARSYEDLHLSSLCLKTCPWITPFEEPGGIGYALLSEEGDLLWKSAGFSTVEGFFQKEILPSLKERLEHFRKEGPSPFFFEKRWEAEKGTRFLSFSLIPSQRTLSLLRGEDHPHRWVLYFQDITEKKIFESQLAREDRLATLGLLTSGVLHEIGNPLSSLATRLHILKRTEDPEKLKGGLTFISQEIQRLSRLVQELSLVNRAQSPDKEPILVRALIEYVVEILKVHPQGKKMQFRIQAPSTPLSILGSFSELCQALLNVGLNAVEVSPPSSEITFELEETGERIAIRVTDRGPGIPQELGGRIFDPFFTTKKGGNGLGLYITRKIVEMHRGEIRFDSTTEGTTFILTFPRSAPSAGASEKDRARGAYDRALPG